MPDTLKAALRTALWTFIGLFALSALGWIQQVAQWASSSGHAPLPGLSVIGYAAVSAAAAAFVGVVNFAVVTAQHNGWLPGNAPSYSGGITPGGDEGGIVNVAVLLAVASAAVLVIVCS